MMMGVDASWTTDTVEDICQQNYLGYSFDMTTDMMMGVCCDAVLGVKEDSTVGTSMLHELGYDAELSSYAREVSVTSCQSTQQENLGLWVANEAVRSGLVFMSDWVLLSMSNIMNMIGVNYTPSAVIQTKNPCLQSNPCLSASMMRGSMRSLVGQLYGYNRQAIATLGSDGVANAWSQQLSFAGSHDMEGDVDESSTILLYIQDYPTYSAMETDLSNLRQETYGRRRTLSSVMGVRPARHSVPHRTVVHTVPGDLLYNASLFVMRGAVPDGVKALGRGARLSLDDSITRRLANALGARQRGCAGRGGPGHPAPHPRGGARREARRAKRCSRDVAEIPSKL